MRKHAYQGERKKSLEVAVRNDDHRTNENSWNERKQEDSVDDDRLEEEDERRNEVPARRSSDDELEKAFGEVINGISDIRSGKK